jgi:hypothetical protein
VTIADGVYIKLNKGHTLRMSAYTKPRIGSGPKEQEVTGGFKRWYNDEFNSFYPSRNIFSTMKSRIMRWVENVAHKREREKETHWL